jgi:hypothetical protein
MSYAGSGAMGNGIFGPYLKDILLSDSVASKYKGEEEKAGRRQARYDYRIPLLVSGQVIQTAEGSGKVALYGSFWVDPQTYDVTRLEMAADEFPPTLPVTEMTTSIDYAPTLLSSGEMVLLPQAAEVRLVMLSGEANHNRIAFTQCRAFEADSTIHFDATDSGNQPARFGVASVDDTLRPLPGGLQIPVKLHSRILGDMPVGALIEGAVASDVTAKHTVVVPAGSPVRGRIRRLERYTEPFPYFIIALEFTEVQAEGIRRLFYADLLDSDPAPGVIRTLATKNSMATETKEMPFGSISMRETRESLSLYDLPGVASFFFKGGKLELPREFRTVWKTRTLR